MADPVRHGEGQLRGGPAAHVRRHPESDPQVYGGTIVLAESLDDVEGAYQEAVAGRPATLPFADICIPSRLRPTLAPEGQHVVSAFTQWVPHTWAAAPHDGRAGRRTPTGWSARLEAVAPGFTDSIVGRQVIGPHEMETEYGLIGGNIFHGELTPGQMFHCRPAAGYADLRTPVRGLYQAGSGDPRRRRGDRHPRPQRGPPGAARPALAPPLVAPRYLASRGPRATRRAAR